MNKEEGWKMYIEIKALKDKGFSNTRISEITGKSRPTIAKYVNMTPEEFLKELESQKARSKKPDKYKNEVLKWIKEHPKMTSAQIYDWLEEKYSKLDFNEVTLRTYVKNLRFEYDIPKERFPRQYEAVEDPPMGKQMQVDFGQKKVVNAEGNEIILYVMCFVLSHSRYKYCQWQTNPFTTREIVKIHENAFEYFGGYPKEAVYDQDHLILTSENHGELIYTKDFAGYIQKRKFKI
jgi:transposase